MSRKVLFTAKNGAHEHVHVGGRAGSFGDRCARLARFGHAVATFVITPGQIKALKQGRRINITDRSTVRAQTYHCTLPDGSLGQPRRRR